MGPAGAPLALLALTHTHTHKQLEKQRNGVNDGRIIHYTFAALMLSGQLADWPTGWPADWPADWGTSHQFELSTVNFVSLYCSKACVLVIEANKTRGTNPGQILKRNRAKGLLWLFHKQTLPTEIVSICHWRPTTACVWPLGESFCFHRFQRAIGALGC